MSYSWLHQTAPTSRVLPQINFLMFLKYVILQFRIWKVNKKHCLVSFFLTKAF